MWMFYTYIVFSSVLMSYYSLDNEVLNDFVFHCYVRIVVGFLCCFQVQALVREVFRQQDWRLISSLSFGLAGNSAHLHIFTTPVMITLPYWYFV